MLLCILFGWVAQGQSQEGLYWVDASAARAYRAKLSGASPAPIGPSAGGSFLEDIVINYQGQTIFYSDSNNKKITTMGMDGSNSKAFYVNSSDSPNSLDLDVKRQNLYFSDTFQYGIRRVNMIDGTGVQTIVPLNAASHCVRLDLRSPGYIYFGNGQHISRTFLNGSNLTHVANSTGTVSAMAFDWTAGKMYWTDVLDTDGYTYTDSLYVADLDGSNKQLVLGQLGRAAAMTVDETNRYLYIWHDPAKGLQRFSLMNNTVNSTTSVIIVSNSITAFMNGLRVWVNRTGCMDSDACNYDPAATLPAACAYPPSCTLSPTAAPTTPTMSPTASPTMSPTASPTMSPTASPTMNPTASPTMSPTASPTMSPIAAPTMSPTAATISPTLSPTLAPITGMTPSTGNPSTSPTSKVTTSAPSTTSRGTKSPTIHKSGASLPNLHMVFGILALVFLKFVSA